MSQAVSSPPAVSIIQVHWNPAAPIAFPIGCGCFSNMPQSCICATGNGQPTNPDILTGWPFTENVHWFPWRRQEEFKYLVVVWIRYPIMVTLAYRKVLGTSSLPRNGLHRSLLYSRLGELGLNIHTAPCLQSSVPWCGLQLPEGDSFVYKGTQWTRTSCTYHNHDMQK